MLKDTELVEKLAEIEHRQWVHFVTNLSSRGVVLPKELEESWRPKLRAYNKLSETDKDKDRMWAHIILECVRPYIVNTTYHLRGVYSNETDKERMRLEQRIIELETEIRDFKIKCLKVLPTGFLEDASTGDTAK